jgi:methylmalonyl-CoA/ethylmalonyl-CoA epimerase
MKIPAFFGGVKNDDFANIALLITLRHPHLRGPGAGHNGKEVVMAARLRHIALSVPDPEQAAKFFEEAFGMKRVGKAGIGCYVSDGTVNVALLKYDGEVPGFHKGYHGLVHFGMWVDNLEETAKKVADAGGSYFGGRPDDNPNTFYEVKYKDPNGIVFDLTHNGWRGAVKEVVPAATA